MYNHTRLKKLRKICYCACPNSKN